MSSSTCALLLISPADRPARPPARHAALRRPDRVGSVVAVNARDLRRPALRRPRPVRRMRAHHRPRAARGAAPAQEGRARVGRPRADGHRPRGDRAGAHRGGDESARAQAHGGRVPGLGRGGQFRAQGRGPQSRRGDRSVPLRRHLGRGHARCGSVRRADRPAAQVRRFFLGQRCRLRPRGRPFVKRGGPPAPKRKR